MLDKKIILLWKLKIKEALYIYKYSPKLSNQIYQCGSSFLLNMKKNLVFLLNDFLLVIFSIIVLDVTKLCCKYLKRKM